MTIIEVTTKEQFLDEIADGRAVVDFWAEWCGPCKRFSPEFEQASTLTDAKFLSVDVDNAPWAMTDYGVRAIPNTQVFVDGEYIRNIMPAKAAAFAISVME